MRRLRLSKKFLLNIQSNVVTVYINEIQEVITFATKLVIRLLIVIDEILLIVFIFILIHIIYKFV